MADGTSDGVDAATLEGPAAAWLADRADELGVSTEEFLERVVASYRAAEAGDDETDVVTSDELEERLDDVESTFEDRLADVEADFDGKIEDVRERVIQVKREADAKAPGDHDHPELAGRAADALDAAREAEQRVDELADELEDTSERLDAGFDNFEEVLSYLRDEADDLERKATTLATAVVSMRDAVASLSAAAARRERVEGLQREANRAGVREADCEDCGESVTVALLTAPSCPFCGAAFDGVDANPGWFGSHVLETGEKPALTGDDALDDGEEEWLGADAATLEEIASNDGERPDDDLGLAEHGAARGTRVDDRDASEQATENEQPPAESEQRPAESEPRATEETADGERDADTWVEAGAEEDTAESPLADRRGSPAPPESVDDGNQDRGVQYPGGDRYDGDQQSGSEQWDGERQRDSEHHRESEHHRDSDEHDSQHRDGGGTDA